MLDERASALLEKINTLCGEGGFKIAEEGELLSCLSAGATKEDVKRALSCLEERRYIEIKYAEEGIYCLRPLPEGRLYFQTLKEQRREGVRRRADGFFLSMLGGFSGALIGGLFVILLLFLVRGI